MVYGTHEENQINILQLPPFIKDVISNSIQ